MARCTAPSSFPYVAKSPSNATKKCTVPFDLQLRECKRGFFYFSDFQLHRAERFAHLMANRLGAVHLAATEQVQINIALSPRAFRRRDRRGEGLNLSGVVLPRSVLLRPAGSGEHDVCRIDQLVRQD